MKIIELIFDAFSTLGSGVLKIVGLPMEIIGVKFNYK